MLESSDWESRSAGRQNKSSRRRRGLLTGDGSMIVVLTGGTGGAKFVDGLRQVVSAKELTVIVNTGDDLEWWGLYVSPDVDSITYVLGGLLSNERGWGVKGDTFFCLETMGRLGQPIWFHVGDGDLAVNLLGSNLRSEGRRLARARPEIPGSQGGQRG